MASTRFRWRTFDGTCNNVANWKWGAQNMEYNRWVNATFDDGILFFYS